MTVSMSAGFGRSHPGQELRSERAVKIDIAFVVNRIDALSGDLLLEAFNNLLQRGMWPEHGNGNPGWLPAGCA